MTIKLEHYDEFSVVKVLKNDKQLGSILYDNPAHKYSADSAFYNLKLQNNTYSDNAVMELFNHYKNKGVKYE